MWFPARLSQLRFRLEPTIALFLKEGEAPHPRLDNQGASVRWEGYINITRGDAYRFRALLLGSFRLQIGDKEVFAAEVKEGKPALRESPSMNSCRL